MKKSKALLLPLALSLLLAGCADSTGNSSESASQESSETSASSSESSTSETSISNSGSSTSETSASSSESSTSETSGSSSSSSDSVIEEITVSITDSKGNSSGTAYVGDTVTLTAKVTGVEEKTVAWSSDHTDIATVSDAGVVTAIKAGTATISATVEGVTATYSLTVENVPVAGIAINNKASCPKLRPNKTYQLSATVTPENAFDKTITWESGDAAIATVDNTGLVTALKAGKVKITAKAGDCSDFVEITILEELTISVVDAKDAKTGTAYVGDTVTLTAKVTGLDGETITWSSNNTEVATVSDAGVVTAIKAGSATISATVGNVSASYSLTVDNVPVEGVAINNKTDCSSVRVKKTLQLSATVTPDTAFDKTVTWESGDKETATVNETGLVTAIKPGKVTITAKAGDHSDTIEITVLEEITVSITDASNNTSGTAYVGDTVTLTAKITGTEGKAIWSSSNTEVATVSDTGAVTAVKAGSATISATVEDVTATYSLTVQNVLVTGISISNKESCSSMKLHEKVQLTATITPENATDKTVTWESSDATVASVDATGLVTAIKQGTAKITAKAGSYSDTVEITVTEPTINAAQSELPESYRVSTYREYQVAITHSGSSKEDAYSFKQNSAVNVTYGEGDSTATVNVPTMKILESEAVTDSNNRVCYVKFIIETDGDYYLFSHGGKNASGNNIDTKLEEVYKVSSTAKTENYTKLNCNNDSYSASSLGKIYAATTADFFAEQKLEKGIYIAQIRTYLQSGDFDFGVASVTQDAETSKYSVISATGEAAVKTVTDRYSMEFVKDKAIFSSSMNIGYCAVDGDLHQFYYKEEDNEYLYQDKKEEKITVSGLNTNFSWGTLLSDKAFKYEKTTTTGSGDDSKTVDVFKANLTDVDNGSGLKLFLSGLGVSEYAQTFMVTTDVETGKVFGLALIYKDGSTVNVGVEAITDLSITVTHHNVNNDGAAGEDSGITQEW